ISPSGFGIALVIHDAGGPSPSRKEAYQVGAWGDRTRCLKVRIQKYEPSGKSSVPAPKDAAQNVSFAPTSAANGMPTVVPGPKKSPRAPAGTSNCLPLVTGTKQAGVGQSAVTLAILFTGTGNALMSPT